MHTHRENNLKLSLNAQPFLHNTTPTCVCTHTTHPTHIHTINTHSATPPPVVRTHHTDRQPSVVSVFSSLSYPLLPFSPPFCVLVSPSVAVAAYTSCIRLVVVT
eukprot:GDKI01037557.1.p1 GENE.GDKI01037557.1~~GDKI01037557.1.p1  ORF type:complete len:120 (-),score=21.15 GDKI01037557.1:76-387(-)